MSTSKRFYTAVAVYLLSLPALMLTLVLWLESLRDKNPASWIPIIFWPLAWGVHFVMSIAWLASKQLSRHTVIAGGFCGIVSLLAFPLSAIASPVGSAFMLSGLASMFMLQLFLVSPAVALVFATSKFHWYGATNSQSSFKSN
jgi:hypothetical protein